MALGPSQIKSIRCLHDKKGRDSEGLFIVEGEKMVAEAIANRLEVVEVFKTAEIGEAAMRRISALSTPSPVLAVVKKATANAPHLRPGGLYLALDGIADPGNMGTILRIADWYGIDGVFLSEKCVDIYNPKTVQSTMGAIFRVKFEMTDLCGLCSRDDVEAFGTFLSGENIYSSSLESSKARIIVVGNESRGISDALAAVCSRRITIPSFADAGCGSESLNAAVACAITVSEFKRRRSL